VSYVYFFGVCSTSPTICNVIYISKQNEKIQQTGFKLVSQNSSRKIFDS
jgi:hypothetical protein